MTRLERDRPAALAASKASQAQAKRENAEQDANARLIAGAPDLVFQLLSAANYIDALGGDSKSYRAAIARATGEPQ